MPNNGPDLPNDTNSSMFDYIKDILKAMNMMRSHQLLTDIVLEVGCELFYAHRVVLASASPYFKAMFTGGLRESDMNRIKLQGITATAMSRLMHFIYTGTIRITEHTVCQLLPAATMLQVTNVIQACCEFLERQLDPTNAIGIADFAEQHGCIDLFKKANQYIERHFGQICLEDEFLHLGVEQLIGLIRKDELHVQDEREVFNSVLKWVKFDEERRHKKMAHILSAVRCQFLPPRFLNDQMTNCDVIRKAPACREYLARIFNELTLHIRPKIKERTPNIPRVIYVAGGYLRQSLDILECYNVDNKTCRRLEKLAMPRSGLGGVFLKGYFYAIGGRKNVPGNTNFDSDWVTKYNPMKNLWNPCSPLLVPRNRVGVAVMDGLLYAVGGCDGSIFHDSIECYDPDLDKWSMLQPMHHKRLALGVAVVNRLLYAVGGYDGVERHNSGECYHPENNSWTLISPMQTCRSGAGMVAINQYIYIIGGYDGIQQLNSVERYDTETDEWTSVANMTVARSALSCTVLDGKIYAIGGYNGQSFLANVEIYDPFEDLWTNGEPLSSGRSGHTSAVFYQQSTSAQAQPKQIVRALSTASSYSCDT